MPPSARASPPRRSLLLGATALGSALILDTKARRLASAPGQAVALPGRLPPAPAPLAPRADLAPAGPGALGEGALRALSALHDLLLPSSPGAPGARDVRATAYVQRVLSSGELDPSLTARMVEGLGQLDEAARRQGSASFADLALAEQDRALRAFVESGERGEAFFELAMETAFEALLGDPVHGGNTGGVAWAWLGIEPGYPRPGGSP